MFKNIFKAAKNLVKSPIGQIGIGILAPQLAASSGILGGIGTLAAKNPALFQAGIGLLGVGLIETDIIRKKNSNSYVNSRNGSQLFGSFSLGREIETKTLNLIPSGTLSLGITELKSYSETGSSALKFDKQNIEY